MELIKNYANWVSDEMMDFLKSCQGEKTPVWQPDRWSGNPILEEYKEKARPGYSCNKYFFHQLNPRSPEMQNFKFNLPDFPEKRSNLNWWFVMLYPGEFQAIHIDPHLTEIKNPIRYSLFLQDWEPGHIFVYDDKILTKYKKGDLYEWNDPMTIHGPCNIGYNTRYTLQVTLYD